MSQSVVIHARTDLETEAATERILAALGLTPTEAIRLFCRQITIRKEFPLELRVPNAVSESVLEMIENDKVWDT
jgi:DNA-damage-inducible protein J